MPRVEPRFRLRSLADYAPSNRRRHASLQPKTVEIGRKAEYRSRHGGLILRRAHIIYSLALLALLGVLLLAGSFAGRSGITPAGAARGGDHFDVRDLIGPNDEEEPTEGQLEALDALQTRTGADVSADFNRLNGTPTSVLARGSFLSAPATGSPRQIAGDFLVDNSGFFAVTPGFVAGLDESRSYVNERSGLAHVEYRQEHGGLPVFQSALRIAVTEDGRVLNVIGDYHPDLPALGSSPALSEAQALDAAFSHVGPPLVLEPVGTATITAALSDAFTPAADLVVFPLGGGDATLAWRVLVPQFIDYWDVVVDAGDGALLYSSNLTTDTGPEGQVFAEHPDASALTTVPFSGSLPAPRDSWVGPTSLSACVICTNGNNVAAIADRLGDFNGFLASAPDTHFNFGFADSWALTGDPDPDEDASVTNLFYLVNVAHDYFYDLGFTEAAGNFQDDNFGAGGLGGDPVIATTYTGFDSCPYFPNFNCLNNAFFSTPPEGVAPVLSSFLFTAPNRDPSFDGDVMLHEYAHGVSTRIVGVGALTGIQSGAMGEGWSDYFAISYYDDPVVGEYSTQNATSGIRHFAYDASPLTYDDLCTAGCEVHDDGEIWAAALWDLRQFYVGDLGLAAGRVAADELIVEGLMLTPPLPSMLDARDAILQAELASGGTNQADLWQVFAGRGMGCSAFSAGDTGTVGAAFDIPVGGVCDGAACDSPASPLAIPGNDPLGVSDTIVIAGSGVIADLRVCLRIDHTRVGDLSASLTHVETGTTVTLVDRPGVPSSPLGCSGDDIIAVLDDAAAAAVEDECAGAVPTIAGTFLPNEPLSAFDGEGIAGSWRLTVADIANPNTGSLIGWSLIPALVDSDADGVEDPLDNCPLWPNPAQDPPPWPVPLNDPDCDGFEDATEAFLSTDPGVACDDGLGLPDWPPDFDDSRAIDIIDVLALKPVFGAISVRHDLDASGGTVNILDVLALKPVFNKSCT